MDGTITVRDVMNRSYVGVSEGDPVPGAAELMRDEGVNGVVVLRGREPVGMLDAADVVALVADGRDPSSATVGEAMGEPAGPIEADSRLSEVIGTFATDDVRRMAVVEGGEVVGVVSEHDVVTAHAALPAGEAGAEAAGGGGPGSFEGEEFVAQGVCEVCGTLTRDLIHDNGQLVCADCLDM